MADAANVRSLLTIVASNVPSNLTEDDITIHFQSRKSGGGDVDKVVMLPDEGQALVTFEAADVAKSVLKHEQKINGSLVQVQSYESWKNRDKESILDESVTTVFVSGIKETASDETVSLFFENKRRYGGGELKEFKRIGPHEAQLTFCFAKDAEEVLKKSTELSLESCPLKVTTNREPTNDKSFLIVVNLSPDTRKETLLNFMEIIAKQGVENIVLGKNNKAIVNLKGEADDGCIERSKEKRLQGSKIEIAFAPLTEAIKISNIPPMTKPDDIKFKFENPRNGGGTITDMMLDRNRGEANVYFEDRSVVSGLVKRKHELDGTELTVTPYYDLFEELQEETTKIEEYSGEILVQRCVMSFITDHHDIEIKFDLKSMNYDQNQETLNFSKDFDDPEEFQKLQTKLKTFLDSFAQDTMKISKNISQKLKEILEEKRKGFQGNSTTVIKYNDISLLLIGKRDDVERSKESIAPIISSLEEKMMPDAAEFTIDDKKQLLFFNFIGYSKKLMTEFPNIRVNGLEGTAGKVMLMGTKESVKDVKNRILEDLAAVAETNVNMTEWQIEFLKRTDCKLVNGEFKNDDISAMLVLGLIKAPGSAQVLQAKLITLKISANRIKSSTKIVFDMTVEKCLRVDDDTGRFLSKSEKLKEFQKEQFEKHNVMVESELTDPSKIWIVGRKSKMNNAVQEATLFIQSNAILTSPYDTNKFKARFLESYLLNDVKAISKRLVSEGVEVSHLSGSFTIKGTKKGVKEATESLQSLLRKVESGFYEVKEPGMKKQMKMDSTSAFITAIETENKCVVERDACKEKMVADDKRDKSKATPPTSGIAYDRLLFVNDKEIKTKTGGQRISVVVGDLSQQKVDVIVNTTNDKVDLNANPCGRALLKKAGQKLKDECKQIGNLKIGEIATTKAGQLDCKLVYHVNCAAWSNGNGESVLRQILQKCLNKIHNDKLTSIALPAIGTGNLNFPHPIVAKIFFEEVVDFLTNNPQTTLTNVLFVAYDRNQPSVVAFMGEIKAILALILVGVSKDKITEDPTNFGSLKVKEKLDGHLEVSLGKNLIVQIVQGDITKESTKMIMHVTNRELSLHGGVANSLTRVGGKEIAKQCKAISQVSLFTVHFTTGGNLSVPQIAHVVAPDRPTPSELVKCLEVFLDAVLKNKIPSVSFSAIGSGGMGLSESDSANVIFTALSKIPDDGKSGLNLVRIAIFEKEKFKKFNDVVKASSFGEKISNPETGATGGLRSKAAKSDRQFCIRIHAATFPVVEKAWSELKKKLAEHIDTKFFDDPNIKKFSVNESKKFKDLQKTHDVELVVEKEKGLITVKGHVMDIASVQGEIFKMLKRMSDNAVPRYWDPQPTNRDGSKVKVHKVKLRASSKEYKEVSDAFLKTAGQQQITNIERIQNPEIFKLYAVKRQSMDEKNGSNEMWLFHGTTREVIDDINTNGLNRSYTGKNATAYGRGVYFARNASCSCSEKYSPADAQGNRYVYYGRVLVDEYTVEQSTMVVPPLKDPASPNEKYNSVVDDVNNPTIFVLFQDYESYTEYLITFK